MLTHPIAFQSSGTMFLALAKTVTALALVKDVRREFPTVYGACTHNWVRMDDEAPASIENTHHLKGINTQQIGSDNYNRRSVTMVMVVRARQIAPPSPQMIYNSIQHTGNHYQFFICSFSLIDI